MTNVQLLVAALIPTFTVIAGLVVQNGRFNALESRMSSLETRLVAIEGDLRRFYEILGRHDAEIEILKRK